MLRLMAFHRYLLRAAEGMKDRQGFIRDALYNECSQGNLQAFNTLMYVDDIITDMMDRCHVGAQLILEAEQAEKEASHE